MPGPSELNTGWKKGKEDKVWCPLNHTDKEMLFQVWSMGPSTLEPGGLLKMRISGPQCRPPKSESLRWAGEMWIYTHLSLGTTDVHLTGQIPWELNYFYLIHSCIFKCLANCLAHYEWFKQHCLNKEWMKKSWKWKSEVILLSSPNSQITMGTTSVF